MNIGVRAHDYGRHTPEELIALLKDIECKTKGTSCPAQLARALEQMLEGGQPQ